MSPRSLRRLSATLLAVGAVSATSLVQTSLSPASAASYGSSSLAVGTYNIVASTSPSTFREAVTRVLPRVDVLGLQEVNGSDKAHVLMNMKSAGWSVFRKQPAPQTPIMWKTSRFELISARTAKISGRTFIGNEFPGRSSYTPAKYVSVVRLKDKQSGQRISLINCHLTPGAVKNGVKRPGRPRMYRLYKKQVANLAGLSRVEGSWGRVFTFGDFNISFKPDRRVHKRPLVYSSFRRLHMPSMWSIGTPSQGGTRLDAFIDQVYAETKPVKAAVQFDISQYSDHKPAIATYHLG